MARGRAHSDETKAAVMAALLAGQGVTEVASEYNIDKTVVSRWKSAMPAGQLQQVATKKEGEIEGKILKYLGVSLDALSAQAVVAGNPEYLKKWPPQQLAVLHGVMADKTIRILEALSPPTEVARPPADDSDPD